MVIRIIRRVTAIVVFVLLTFFFLDFAGLLPGEVHALAHIQFIPALMSMSIGILCGLLLLTLLFGRLYCSVLCPTGVFQDIARRCGRPFLNRKRFSYSTPKTALRWGIVAVVAITMLLGFTLVVAMLDPYSIYGRIVTNIFRPVYLLGNNLLANIFTSNGNYTFYYMDAGIVSLSAFAVALIFFFVIGYMGMRHGRTYCNTVCPVGTILGLVSRFSLWKVRIDPGKCTGCGICAAKCKASCIDAKGKDVDSSRCVACYNCVGSCRFGALSYSLPKKHVTTDEPVSFRMSLTESDSKNTCVHDETVNLSRRRFFLTSATAIAAGQSLLATDRIGDLMIQGTSRVSYRRTNPICPPGAESADNLLKKCTSCHLCISKCPVHIIKPSFNEYGLAGFMMPTISYEKGYCSYDCTICSEVCPNHALMPLTVAQKNITQIGRVTLIEENCVVHTDGTSCGACSEHCPTQAVKMVPFRDGLTKPEVDPEICVGCGGCEFICPVRPFRAIYVNGNPIHHDRKSFEEAEKTEMEFEGFGF